MPARRAALMAAVAVAGSLIVAACSNSDASTNPTSGTVAAVGAENEYADVISQIGGKYVHVTAIESNPNTDPHTFEASASVGEEVSAAELIVQNGVDYDNYMTQIEHASPNSARKVINVQELLGLPVTTPNPHLWYAPTTMPAVAQAIEKDLAALRPAHQAYFAANLTKFDNSLKPWYAAIAAFKKVYAGNAVAVTEPVGDYLITALGLRNLTPFGLQADVMNGVDLSPQYVTLEKNLLSQHKVKVFVYNQQVVDSTTQSFLSVAEHAGVPVVGVYETMPTPGYHYQSWMVAEVNALTQALAHKVSTQKL